MLSTVRVYYRSRHRFFDDLFNMLVSVVTFGSAAEAFRGGSPTLSGMDVGVPGNVVSYDLLVTPMSLMQPMLEDRRPDTIKLKQWARVQVSLAPTVEKRREPGRILSSAIYASFVRYYDSVEDLIKAAYGDAPSKWPDVLRFGWVVRNAFAHDGKVRIKSPQTASVRWRSLSYSYADNGRPILYSDLEIADLIFLMEEMDSAI